jgi:GTP 3',8-cyclase
VYDQFERRINYLRISVTDRCNLRCVYCMPADGVDLIKHEELLSLEEIYEIACEAVDLGFDKIRITGGEPLVRNNILFLIERIAAIAGLRDFGMTTNGILLTDYAKDLVAAGLHRVNISLDTLDPERYRQITRCGDLGQAIDGILAAKAAGFRSVKLNCVIREFATEPDAVAVAEFARTHDLNVRFIRQMDLDKGEFWVVQGGSGGDCQACNRLRLTSTGLLKPCLFSDLSYDVRQLGTQEAFRRALAQKPASGHRSGSNTFYETGG